MMNTTRTKKYKILFQPSGVRLEVEEGENLLEAARNGGVSVQTICGGHATCGKCAMVIQEGDFPKDNIHSSLKHLSPVSESEKKYWEKQRNSILARGEDPESYRLSCQAQVYGDLVVMIPERSRGVQQIIRKDVQERAVEILPIMRKIYVELDEPSLANPRGDWERLKDALLAADEKTRGPQDIALDAKLLTIDYTALKSLQEIIREGKWWVTATIRGGVEVLRVEPGYAENLLGMAVDIGTTTIVAYLCDLYTGEVISAASMMNPQVAYGEDVMSRISYTNSKEGGLQTLQNAVINALDKLARQVCGKAHLKSDQVVEMVVVGNSVMLHLFLGLNPQALGAAPYVPAMHTSLEIKARDLGLRAINSAAYIYTLPMIASFVGADAMGVILAEAPYEQDEYWLIIDVGTNAELVLGNRKRMIVTSTPTGPAFEGAQIKYGMRAAKGAIERVRIDPHTLTPSFKVIGSDAWSDENTGEMPLASGICGTGIIDAVAELYRTGIVRSDGRFANVDSPNLREKEAGIEYILAEENQTTFGEAIPITQDDIRQIQLAKAPLYVAAKYLLNASGVKRPERVLLAGGFGSIIDPLKAMLLGMVPDMPLDRVYGVGNSAGEGARMALLNRDLRRLAMDLMGRIEFIELPVQPEFQERFMLALNFPHMVDPYPHLEDIAPPREVDPVAISLFGENVRETHG
jgi:uncharacterized 2Fe-2S/4Fe-4S cluster protein (DUF4445 family)